MLVAQVVSRLSGCLEAEGNVCTVWASLNLHALHSANYLEAHLELQGPFFIPPTSVGLEQFWLKLPPEAVGQSLALQRLSDTERFPQSCRFLALLPHLVPMSVSSVSVHARVLNPAMKMNPSTGWYLRGPGQRGPLAKIRQSGVQTD